MSIVFVTPVCGDEYCLNCQDGMFCEYAWEATYGEPAVIDVVYLPRRVRVEREWQPRPQRPARLSEDELAAQWWDEEIGPRPQPHQPRQYTDGWSGRYDPSWRPQRPSRKSLASRW